MAEWTGLEPATLGVTGRYSNQLNYHSAIEGLVYGLITNMQVLFLGMVISLDNHKDCPYGLGMLIDNYFFLFYYI